MLFRILRKSISKRKSKIAIAVIAVVVGISVITALVNVSFGVREKIGNKARAYGANILLVPKTESIPIVVSDIEYGSVSEQNYIDENDLSKIETIEEHKRILGYAPYLYGIVRIGEQKAVLTGTWLDQVKKISPWWEVEGSWIENRTDYTNSMLGISIAQKLNLSIGNTFTIAYNDTKNETSYLLYIVGIVNTGGSEDNQIFVTLDFAQEITKRPDKVSSVQVSALCHDCPTEIVAAQIEEKIPNIEAKSVKQAVMAEMSILNAVEQLMFLVAAIALLTSALGVMMTMTTSVIERKREIGLMKALGAENKKIAFLFLSESVFIGVLGGLLGYGTGIMLAELIAKNVFGTQVSLEFIVFPVALSIAVGISALASVLPVKRAISIEPAVVLRGM